jgi:hypothetical protein
LQDEDLRDKGMQLRNKGMHLRDKGTHLRDTGTHLWDKGMHLRDTGTHSGGSVFGGTAASVQSDADAALLFAGFAAATLVRVACAIAACALAGKPSYRSHYEGTRVLGATEYLNAVVLRIGSEY